MPAKSFSLSKKANKQINNLPLRIQNKIGYAFKAIKQNPISGTKLHGELESYYKFRVGDYRVVYLFNPETQTVYIVKIEHRQGVYK